MEAIASGMTLEEWEEQERKLAEEARLKQEEEQRNRPLTAKEKRKLLKKQKKERKREAKKQKAELAKLNKPKKNKWKYEKNRERNILLGKDAKVKQRRVERRDRRQSEKELWAKEVLGIDPSQFPKKEKRQ